MTKPQFITTQTGAGPMTALDIAAIPDELKTRIIAAAYTVAMHVGNGSVCADEENKVADEALDDLTKGIDALGPLFVPAAPGAQLWSGQLPETYSVIRDGEIVNATFDEMLPIEIAASCARLRVKADALSMQADAIRRKADGEVIHHAQEHWDVQ